MNSFINTIGKTTRKQFMEGCKMCKALNTPPNELCLALLLSLTVQRSEELRCSAAGFLNFCPF
jgi:hypothetical protein